jgi:hypothetical protein
MSDEDPKGVAEAPDTVPMQNMVDSMRRRATDRNNPVITNVCLSHAADMMETMIDWLADQHRLIEALKDPP